MVTRAVTFSALVALVALTACDDGAAPEPTLSPDPAAFSSHAALDAQEIRDQIEALFPAPGLRNAALSRFSAIERQLDRGRDQAAESQALNLVEFTLDRLENDQLLDPNGAAPPSTLAAVAALVADLNAFVGLTASPTFTVHTDEGTIAVVSDEGGTVTTEDEFAGVDVPDASTDEPTVLTIQRLDQDPCLPTGLPQFEGCYQFDKFPDTDFQDEVVVGVCIDPAVTGTTKDRILLHKFDPDSASLGVVPLDNVAAPFLDCAGFTVAGAESPWPVRLARQGLRHVSRWLAPPLYAAHTGAGGLTISFSDFGWVLPPELAFDSDRDGDRDIFISNPTGHGFLKLADSDSVDLNPIWSPDGSQVMFGSRRTANLEVHTVNADDTGLFQVTTSPGYDLGHSWSPDATRLAITSARPPSFGIYLINADGTGSDKQLAQNAGSPDISPDGLEVVFEGNDSIDGGLDIFKVDTAGVSVAPVGNDPVAAARPTWSPDGTRIAFLSVRDGNSEVYVMDADGTNATRLTNHPGFDSQPVWSPDGSLMAFETSRTGSLDIYVMNADGSGLTRITTSSADDRNPHWKPAP